MSQLKNNKNDSTKKDKIVKDAQDIIDTATVLSKLKFDGDKYKNTTKSDNSNDLKPKRNVKKPKRNVKKPKKKRKDKKPSDFKSSKKKLPDKKPKTDWDDSYDDVEIWNGKKYYYHPPALDDRVKTLWDDGNWYVGTIIMIYPPTKTIKKNRYLVKLDNYKYKWKVELPIKNYPKKWHFDDDGIE